MGEGSSDADNVAWDNLGDGVVICSVSLGTIANNSPTVLPFRSRTPDELAASINGRRLLSPSISFLALAWTTRPASDKVWQVSSQLDEAMGPMSVKNALDGIDYLIRYGFLLVPID